MYLDSPTLQCRRITWEYWLKKLKFSDFFWQIPVWEREEWAIVITVTVGATADSAPAVDDAEPEDSKDHDSSNGRVCFFVFDFVNFCNVNESQILQTFLS